MSNAIPKLYAPTVGSDNKHCVEGPGNGFGYNAGTLWPNLRLSSEQDAKAAAELCNQAFRQGYLRAQRDIRIALGAG